MRYGVCPNCEIDIDIDEEPEIGNNITCRTCLTESVIVWLNPIELSIIDYEDYGFDDDDFSMQKNKKTGKRKGEHNAPRKTKKEQ